jgi:crotonobetaine/carnitine-CoA ligase
MSGSISTMRPIPPGAPSQLVSAADDDAGGLALDPDRVLPRRVASWAEQDPDRPFLQEVTGRAVSYAESIEGIRRWATVLRDLGVAPGDRVLSMLPASIDAYLLWMAAGCVGACEVPVNPELRGTFLSHALEASGARLCLARPEFVPVAESAAIPGLDVVAVDRERPPTVGAVLGEIDWPTPEDESCIIYTSGTTGPAKGAILSWAQMAATIGRIPRSWLTGDDAVYCCHSAFHVTGRSPLPAMADVGGRVVLRERFSLHDFWGDVCRHGCTSTTAFVPLLLGLPEREDDRENPLRVVLAGQSGRQTERFSERFGAQVVTCYGSTEVGFPIATRWPKPLPESGPVPRDCGWLRRGYAARIVGEDGQEVPDGTSGELWIRPPSSSLMMRGYNGLPEKTASAIVDGWYHTGDALIRHPDGCFEFNDRLRDTIRRMGENISSSSLEAVVLGDDEVQDCAAIGVSDEVAGQEVFLLVVPRQGRTIDPEALSERLEGELPRYMQPAYVLIVEDAAVPRTPTNKIRKVALLDAFNLEDAWRSPRVRRAPAKTGA